MADRSPTQLEFSSCLNRKVKADFNGGNVSSDGGVLLLREVDRKLNPLSHSSTTTVTQTRSSTPRRASSNNGGGEGTCRHELPDQKKWGSKPPLVRSSPTSAKKISHPILHEISGLEFFYDIEAPTLGCRIRECRFISLAGKSIVQIRPGQGVSAQIIGGSDHIGFSGL